MAFKSTRRNHRDVFSLCSLHPLYYYHTPQNTGMVYTKLFWETVWLEFSNRTVQRKLKCYPHHLNTPLLCDSVRTTTYHIAVDCLPEAVSRSIRYTHTFKKHNYLLSKDSNASVTLILLHEVAGVGDNWPSGERSLHCLSTKRKTKTIIAGNQVYPNYSTSWCKFYIYMLKNITLFSIRILINSSDISVRLCRDTMKYPAWRPKLSSITKA